MSDLIGTAAASLDASPDPMAADEQLTLLPEPSREPGRLVPRRRLDERTRRIGLAGVAQARAILEEQARRRAERELSGRPPFVRPEAA